MKRILFVILLATFTKNLFAELPKERSLIGDFTYSFKLLLKGSYTQFTTKENLYYAVASVPSVWHSFEEDDRYTAYYKSKKIRKHEENISDLGIVLTFPVIPLSTYALSRYNGNEKLLNFSIEFTSAVYLTLAESALISLIPIHDRPDKTDLSPWETNFRGDSSFPSGHVVPYATLMFKAFQFYGPYTLILTSAMFYFASKERMKSGKHTMSDVVGSFFIAAFASEGVRRAHQYKDNHPIYNLIFNHNVNVSYIRHEDVIGPRIAWDY